MGAVRRHLDRFGDGPWSELETDVAGRVSLEVHRRFVRRTVPVGSRVLEIGAAGGRFTVELAALGCRVVVTDPSPARLVAHERRLAGTPAAGCVLRRDALGLAGSFGAGSLGAGSFDAGSLGAGSLGPGSFDAGSFDPGSFDAVLAYAALPAADCDSSDPRGPAAAALRGLLRLVGPEGVVVASVPSLLGGLRRDRCPTGTARADGGGRYRWSDVVAFTAAAGGRVVDGSASNWASLGDHGALASLEADPSRWEQFLDGEVSACAEPGARDGGTHILLAVRAARP